MDAGETLSGDLGNFTLLTYAAQQGNIEIVNALIEAGADVNERNHSRSILTALHQAADSGQVEVVKALLEAGAYMGMTAVGGTPLHLAARKGHTEIVKAMLEAGGNPNIRTNNNFTALYSALGSAKN